MGTKIKEAGLILNDHDMVKFDGEQLCEHSQPSGRQSVQIHCMGHPLAGDFSRYRKCAI